MLGYFAGIIDGEGCIGVRLSHYKLSPYHSLFIEVNMTDTEAIDLLYACYRGTVRTNELPSGKILFRWSLFSKQAMKFLEDIYDYLQVKKEQARVGIELEKRKKLRGCTPLSQEELGIREGLYLEIKRLNQRTSSLVSKK